MGSRIYVLYYYDVYNSDVLWRTRNDFDNSMSSLKIISSHEHALKKNILICVMGFAWTEFSHA